MSWRDAVTISKYSVKNVFNRVNSTPLVWLVVLGLQVVLVGMGLSPGSGTGALDLGRALAEGEVAMVAARLSSTIMSFFVLLTVFSAIGWTTGSAEAEAYESGFLSMTSARNVALGNITKTAILLLGGWLPVITVLSVAFGYVAGRPIAGVAFIAPLCVLFVTTQLLGALIGMAVQYGVTYWGVSEQADSVIGLVVAMLSGMVFAYPSRVGEFVLGTPLGAIGKGPVWVFVPAAVPTETVVVATAVLLSINLVSFVAVSRFAESFYLDNPSPATGEEDSDFEERNYDDRGLLRSLTERVFPTRQAVLVTLNWRRAMRSSELLERIGLYVMFGLAVGVGTLLDGSQFGRVPIVLVLFGCFFAGTVVTTNALSDEGHRLALWGTTAVSARDIYISKTASTAIPSILVFGTTAVVTAMTVSEYSPFLVLLVVVLAVVGIGASAAIATGIGCHWLISSEETDDSEMSLPSLLVLGVHNALIVMLLVPGASVVLLGLGQSSSQSMLTVGGMFAGTIVSLVGCSVFFFVSSVRKMGERHYGSII